MTRINLQVRVGKLTQDRLTLASSTDLDSLVCKPLTITPFDFPIQPQDKSEIDTSIAPTGGVQEKASAFSTPKVHTFFLQNREQRIVLHHIL